MLLRWFFLFIIILLETLIIAYIGVRLYFRIYPLTTALFWVFTALEIVLGYLSYFFWIRAREKKASIAIKITMLVCLLLGLILPTILYLINPALQSSTGYTELFFLGTVIGLLIFFYLKKIRRSAT